MILIFGTVLIIVVALCLVLYNDDGKDHVPYTIEWIRARSEEEEDE